MDSRNDRRFLLGGAASLLLVLWIALVPGAVPGLILSPAHPPERFPILVSASLSVSSVIPLSAVLFRGSLGLRLLSVILLIPPSFALLWIFLGGFDR